jgi:hypothetical protein
MKKQEIRITYIPIGCPNIEEMVAGTGLKADKIRLLLHQLTLSRLSQAGHVDNDKKHPMNHIYKDGYVALDRSILKSLLSTHYKKYVTFLIEKQIIHIRASSSSPNAYTPGVACIHYKINPSLLVIEGTERHFRQEVVTDYCTVKAVIKTTDNYQKSSINNPRSVTLEPIHESLFAMEKLIRFQLDDVDYWVSNNQKEGEKMNMIDQVNKLHAINTGYFNCKVDQFGERLYTPLKSVKSEFRNFMYFEHMKESRLSSFDVCNSQLYFLTLLFNPNIVNEIIPEFSPINEIAANYFDSKDVQTFIKFATDGSIYTKWQEFREFSKRDLAKKELIAFLFAKKNSPMKGIGEFKRLLPNLKAFIDDVKTLTEEQLPFIKTSYLDAKGVYKLNSYHCNLACAVQRLESRIFIKRFGQNLLNANVEPFFTMHDSIYYPENLSNKVAESFNQTFAELGIPKPKIKASISLF